VLTFSADSLEPLMKNRIWGMCLAVLGAAGSADAALVSQWDFGIAATGPLSVYAASTIGASVTSAGLTTSGGAGPSPAPSAAVGVLQYTWGGNHADYLNGAVLQLHIITTGATFAGFSVTYDTASSSLTSLSGMWSYSVNGGTVSTLGLETITPNGIGQSDLLSGISLANGNTLDLSFTLSGAAGGNNGSFSFDNLALSASSITPVPEPVNVALGFFAVVALGVTVGRRVLKARAA
jgi:hypothetical protein